MRIEEARADYLNALADRQGWPEMAIGEIADVNPRVDKASIPDDLPVSFVPMPAVGAGDGSIRVEETRAAGEVKKGFTAFLEGDVLFAKITPCMENGKMAVVPALINGYGFGSTEFHVLRPKQGMDAKYLYYYVSSQTFRSEAERHMTGAVGQRRVPTTYLKECKIPVAPLDQQKRIVAEIEKQFSRLDQAVANLKRVKANLKRYKAAVLKAAVEGRLVETEAELARRAGRSYETGEQLLQRILETRRSKWQGKGKYKEPTAPDTTDLPELPEGWVWATAEQLTDENRAITYGVIKLGEPVDGGVPVLRSSDVRQLRIDLDDVKRISPEIAEDYRRTFLKGGEVVMTVRGTLGGIAVVPSQCNGFNVSREVAMLALVDPKMGQLVALFVASAPLENWLMRRAKGIAYTGINIETLKALPIPVPPMAEHSCIVAEVERRLSLLRETEVQVDVNLQRAERLRQSILSRAFSGGLIGDRETISADAAAGAA